MRKLLLIVIGIVALTSCLTTTYKCDKKVLVRLNQTDFLSEEEGLFSLFFCR